MRVGLTRTTKATGLAIVCIGAAQVACNEEPQNPGEFNTTHIAQVNGLVLNALRVPQESITVTGRALRLDAGYDYQNGITDASGRFVLKVGRIDAQPRPEPDTISVMVLLFAHGSKYPRAPDGSQLRDSVPVVVRFAAGGKPTPIASVEAIFRGL